MEFLSPFKQAFHTPVGDLLLFLIICTTIALGFYAYFWVRFGRHKDLTITHHNLFKKVQSKLKDYQFVGYSFADLFGKKQMVALPDGRYGRCLIVYPEISNTSFNRRFQDFHLLIQQKSSSFFPRNYISLQDHVLVNVETQFVKADGNTTINFAQHDLHKKLSLAEKEKLLIDLAYMLESLHLLKTESNEPLYHGLLLPSSLYVSLNLVQKITNIHLADYGCVFAMGGEYFANWLQDFYRGKYIVDQMVKEQLDAFKFIFSPEQLNDATSVTKATDFYSFAALSVFVFTREAFDSIEDIDWQQIPLAWRPFLKQCLNDKPLERPSNFLELKEYFEEPDFALDIEHLDNTLPESVSKESLQSISTYYKKASDQKQALTIESPEWHKGYLALKDKNWELATSCFQSLLESAATTFEAHLGFALLNHQLGNQELCEKHYSEAKKIDAKRIDLFQKFIAFDI